MSIPLIYQNSPFDIYYPVSTKEIVRTEQIWLENIDILLCHTSKNLWNEANYIVRQLFTQKDKDGNNIGQYMKYSDLDYLIKHKSENYKKLSAQTSQQILKILDRSWKSFFEAIKEWRKNPEKFLGRPKLPGYKKKDGESLLVFTNQQVKIIDGYLKFPKKLNILNQKKIKSRLDDETNLREVRIIPKGDKYVIEIVYQIEEHQLDLNKDRIIGIDFGLRNIVTVANNIGEQPICIKGGVLKSINQFYNKRLAELKSIYSKQFVTVDNNKKQSISTAKCRLTGPAIRLLTNNRNNKIKDVMHKYSRYIIDYCIEHNIGTIVMGHNKGQKQNIDLGKKTNQNFVQIPEYLLRKMIKYKGEEIGISVIEQNESHTSKCSFLDDEPIGHREVYAGKRIYNATCHGGLFKSAKGIIINADVQGAYNIIKKAIPTAFSTEADHAIPIAFSTEVEYAIPKAFTKLKVLRSDGIEGDGLARSTRTSPVGLHPVRVNPLLVPIKN